MQGLQQVAAHDRAERLGRLSGADQHSPGGEVERVDRREEVGPRLQDRDLFGVEIAKRAGLRLNAEVDQPREGGGREGGGKERQGEGGDGGGEGREAFDSPQPSG